MHEGATFARFDLLHARKRGVHVFHQLNRCAKFTTHLHAKRVRRFGHHHRRGGTEHARRVAQRNRVIARRYANHAAGQCLGVEIEHHRQRAAWLETAGALKELFLDPHACAVAHRARQRVVHQQAHRGGDHAIAQPFTVGADRVDGREVGVHGIVAHGIAAYGIAAHGAGRR